ncbi:MULTISPECIES: hypothetical protein [unclassified Treponema]|uniref:hypothetical protein n=1 Tax=unclassified Treponema TaxID=2638727 RepID=UPI000E833702|nr:MULTISPECIES: hypothetical protein [unclassified Treponema]HAZ97230.1 hypothetical protein [Treponema sp.]HBP09414.1 hypothetical protein [Treponema sp.]
MTNKNVEELTRLMRQLVSDVQGAPFPSEKIEPELYSIWYEHVQRGAQNCFEFLEQHFPLDNSEFKDSLKKIFK